MKTLMALVLGVAFCAGQALAMAVEIDQYGKVVTSSIGTYDGPGLGLADLAVLGTVAVASPMALAALEAPTALYAIAPATFIVWGALRTAKYRPQEAKDRIRENLAKKAATPAPGSVGDVLSSK